MAIHQGYLLGAQILELEKDYPPGSQASEYLSQGRYSQNRGFRFRSASEVTISLFREKFQDMNIGSPYYMAPEAFIDNIYGSKTDVWSFGIIMYELLHGKTPFFDILDG
jgi:serine/threonine protein kinase